MGGRLKNVAKGENVRYERHGEGEKVNGGGRKHTMTDKDRRNEIRMGERRDR